MDFDKYFLHIDGDPIHLYPTSISQELLQPSP